MKRKGLLVAGLLGMALPIGSSWAVVDDPGGSSEKPNRPSVDRRAEQERADRFLDRLFDGRETVDRDRFETALKRVRQAKGKAGDTDRREAAAGKLFDRLDANGDGKLTRDEAKKLPTRVREAEPKREPEREKGKPEKGKPAGAGERDGDRLFEAIAGGKGQIGRDLFESYLKRQAPRIDQHPKAAERLFNHLDDNHDGKLDRDELKKMPDAMERLRKAIRKDDR